MKNPLIPMFSVTGNPSRVLIRRELDSYRSVGIDQILIYPRSGLEVEYMGSEWLETCRHIIEYADEYNMSIWLYDEYNWPSGKCKGQVLRRNKDYACKKMSIYVEGDFYGRLLAEEKPLDYHWSISSVPLYADLLNTEAVDCFIELTYEKYKEKFSQYFGSVIKGFFTDEPSFVYAADYHKDQRALLEFPYYNGLEEDYFSHTGREFKKDIEGQIEGNTHEKLWSDFYAVLGNRFASVYIGKLNDWCAKNKLLLTGHLLLEAAPHESVHASGNPMQVVTRFSLPALDEIYTELDKDKLEWVTLKQTENAVLSKNNGGLAELFALGPCDMALEKTRQMIWLNALHGIDHYVLALSAMDARGNIEKRFYYNPFTKAQPWFDALKELGDNAQTAARFAKKTPCFDLAVRYPQTLTAERLGKKDASELPLSLERLFALLSPAQWQVKLIAEDESPSEDFKVILNIHEDGIYDEQGDEILKNEAQLLRYLKDRISRSVLVLDAAGELSEDILLKTYTDGSVCVLSLTDKALKELSLNGKTFNLPGRGIFAPGVIDETLRSDASELPEILWDLELLRPNLMRCLFDENGKCEINAEEDLTDLKFNLRNYGPSVKITLDGKTVESTKDCTSLPSGFRELYTESKALTLTKGRHILSLCGEVQDFAYLPNVFISGKFGLFEDNTIGKLPQKTQIKNLRKNGLLNYAGKIKLRGNVKLPESEYIRLDTGKLVTELSINGGAPEARLWSPFAWQVPEKSRNTTSSLELTVSTSIGPIFGKFPHGKWGKYSPA